MVRASSCSSMLSWRRPATRLFGLLWHLHVELDRCELLGGHSHSSSERQPARVRMEIRKHRVYGGHSNREVFGVNCLVEPLECAVGFTAECQHKSNASLIRLVVFLDELTQCRIGLVRPAECVIDHR